MTKVGWLKLLQIGIDVIFALALAILIFFTFGVIAELNLNGVGKAWFFFWFFLISPFRILPDFLISFPFSAGLLAIFFHLVRIKSKTWRIFAMTIWFIGWGFYGAMCLSILTGGA